MPMRVSLDTRPLQPAGSGLAGLAGGLDDFVHLDRGCIFFVFPGSNRICGKKVSPQSKQVWLAFWFPFTAKKGSGNSMVHSSRQQIINRNNGQVHCPRQ